MQFFICVIKVLCHHANVQLLSRSTPMFHSLTKFAMVKPLRSYGNCLNVSPLNMVLLFSYPYMYTAFMNEVGSIMWYCVHVNGCWSMTELYLSACQLKTGFCNVFYTCIASNYTSCVLLVQMHNTWFYLLGQGYEHSLKEHHERNYCLIYFHFVHKIYM